MTEDDLTPRQRALAGEFVKEGYPMQDAIEMAGRSDVALPAPPVEAKSEVVG